MNVGKLMDRIVAQLGQDEMESDERELAIAYLQEAHEEMMRVYRPYVDIRAAVDEKEGLALEELGPRAGKVCWVVRNFMELPFTVEGGRLFVRGGQGETVCLRCRYNPAKLSQEEDVPELPEGFHGALADFATYRMMGNGGRARQQRGEMYFARYLQRRAMLSPEGEAWRSHLIHKYE